MTASVVFTRSHAEVLRELPSSKGVRFDALDAALATEPDWPAVRQFTRRFAVWATDPASKAMADQNASSYTRLLAGFGVNPLDDNSLHTAVAVLALVTAVAGVTHQRGVLAHDHMVAVANVVSAVGSALTVLLPDEAR